MARIGRLGVSGLLVIGFVLLALLGFLPGAGPIGLSWFAWALIVGALYLVGVGTVFRGASAGSRRVLKLAAPALAAFFLLSVFILPAMQVGVPPIADGAPQAQLTIAEGTAFDFPDFTTDGDGATGVSEIALNSETLTVTLQVTADASADTLIPDSFAVAFTLRCTGGCSVVRDGALVETPYHARIVGLGDWVIEGNTTPAMPIVEKNSAGTKQIAWTDTGSNTIVGPEDGGAMNLFSDGESGTFTFSVYMNENGLPKGIPTGQVYTRSAVIEIFSPRGGTSFQVTLALMLTANV